MLRALGQIRAGGVGRRHGRNLRVAPIAEEGGRMNFRDHRVPPDVSLAYKLLDVRMVCCKVASLKPMGVIERASVLANTAAER